jgi:hypothetical protein
MRDLIDWLTDDKQANLFEILVGLGLNLLFLGLAAVLLWPLGSLPLAGRLLQGFLVLWAGVAAASAGLGLLHAALRINLYDRYNLFVGSNLAVSAGAVIAWAAFAAATIQSAASGAAGWAAVILYAIGLLSCLSAHYVVSAFFQGTIYRLVNLPVAALSFLVFSLWMAWR